MKNANCQQCFFCRCMRRYRSMIDVFTGHCLCSVARLQLAILETTAGVLKVSSCWKQTLVTLRVCCTVLTLSLCPVFRCQLPRINEFYPFDPPTDEMPEHVLEDHQVLGSGLKLCRLCGCLGQKACSRCHSVTYCCKEHQTIDWKKRHKKECANEGECG